MKLLHIDSSILGNDSVSRTLSAEIVARQVALHPSIEVTYRDLASEIAEHLSIGHVAVRHGATVEEPGLLGDIKKGDEYLDELFDADIVVVGAPMYNFSISSQLKVWIDRVVVAGRTFKYSQTGEIQTLLPTSKQIFIASTRGSAYSAGSPYAALEHHESYLKGVFSFLGQHDVTVIRAEGLAFGPEAKNAAISQARGEIASILG
ncbi:FMN-dependent NADH-azoreductase [Paraburkholderia steynii]|uniref:FMN dependent NADH:quinone oxidoreductase n=1 Tax=Paraburkholderia steynii TaxID=1245441 RepID=A0A7Z7BB51_9BURK|nr:NAD(P)H-dependent oxidoreductase [Paraburkholderia steynii]SDI51845.1 FMN-dependent NADH-azoreductase [Paraburkholderia steynii]